MDVDVPLFLPIYGQRRQHDLRRMAVREIREAFRIDGQVNFDSGWEWGYWLSDVVTARASWDPLLPLAGSSRAGDNGRITTVQQAGSAVEVEVGGGAGGGAGDSNGDLGQQCTASAGAEQEQECSNRDESYAGTFLRYTGILMILCFLA